MMFSNKCDVCGVLGDCTEFTKATICSGCMISALEEAGWEIFSEADKENIEQEAYDEGRDSGRADAIGLLPSDVMKTELARREKQAAETAMIAEKYTPRHKVTGSAK